MMRLLLLLLAQAASAADKDVSYGAICVATHRMCRVDLPFLRAKPKAICWASPRCMQKHLIAPDQPPVRPSVTEESDPFLCGASLGAHRKYSR